MLPRPHDLVEIPVSQALQPKTVTITMSKGQWDVVLAAAYDEGCILLELDRNEQPRRAYRKPLNH